ncbi:MAG: lysoplasmalogenase [Lachnospiraceae bacterium]|nr:lysoplasmalogenase [Lachnospiraceae bacterium]
MEILRYLMLAVFLVSAGIHLYASLKNDKPLRNKTKPFILTGLLGFYCCAAKPVVLFAVLALAFSWLGDLLLIPKGNKWFTAGGIAFMVSHVFFILTYLRQTELGSIRPAVIAGLILFFVTASLVFFKYLRPHLPKALFYPMLAYLILNGLMNCFAWFRCLTLRNTAGLVTAAGALLFFLSDSSLFLVRFHKNSPLKTHFWVMLTYSLGEFLIVLGLIMG